jgi:hypothetical protein
MPVTDPSPDPQAEEELRLAGRFIESLRAGDLPAALIQLAALHDLRELSAGNEPEAGI